MYNVIFYNNIKSGITDSDYTTQTPKVVKKYQPVLVDGYMKYYNISGINEIKEDTSKLINGYGMFYNCYDFKNPPTNLDNLKYGYNMFSVTNIEDFSTNMNNLLVGDYMFSNCSNLKSFKSEIKKMINGNGMFLRNSNLTSFHSDTISLLDGGSMFRECKNLKDVVINLSSLLSGSSMFYMCKLSPTSVMHIAESIRDLKTELALYENHTKDYVSYYGKESGFTSSTSYLYYTREYKYTTSGVGYITIGIDCKNNIDDLNRFAQEAYYESWQDLKNVFTNKGWKATFQIGGTSTNITLSEDEQFRSTPVYARLIEEEDKERASYCTEDGEKYYNIDWGHDVTNYDDYQYFGSLLEACGYFGVIPKEYLEEA